MGRRLFAGIFLFPLLMCSVAAQDFSNKGKDFWVGYGLHCRMFQNNNGGTQDMVLYFATEAVTNVTVSIPSLGYTQTYANIPANTIFTSNTLPKTGTQDARLTLEGTSNKGIHITSDKPIVAYAHIYNGNVSGATLLFPTTTLGKEYYSVNFEQHSNEANSNCFFYAIATDTGTTTIEVIPSANTQTMQAGQTYTFNLTQGQVFNALGTINGSDGVDLTGSRIRSISSGTAGCKRIAVFSGSGKINIKCPLGPSSNSADNYMVQAFPKNAWGKYYLTVPTQQMPYNFFRIAVTDPTTVVKLNGNVLTGLINNFYYQVLQTNQPNLIEADKPVMVAQYITSANVCGNTAISSNGDPEVIYLSPVEQNIDKVILNSTPNSAISAQLHYVNVVIPNGGTGVSSFRIDGLPPSTAFVPHPRNAAYSYLIQNVTPGQHVLQADSGFNAIAYGYGGAESYGYNAGANVKDLYQFVSIRNQYATVNFPAACKSSPFFFSMTFPYQPTQIKWQFNGLFPDVTINAPVFDSTWTVNGKQLYLYKLQTPYTINTLGTYPIKVVAQNPTPEGCSGEQEINYDLQVFDRPVADFTFTTSGCVSDSVHFFDNSNTGGRPTIIWSYDFADGGTSPVKNPVHLFTTAGSYPVKFSVITDIGCLSDTISKTINLAQAPVARFGFTSPNCVNRTISFSDSSTTFNSAIVKWFWDFGDGSAPLTVLTNAPQSHTFTTTGTFTVTLKVETATGCQSTVFSQPVTIYPNPAAAFSFGNACLPVGAVQFTDQSTISDGTQNQFTYQWTFGDGSPLSGLKDPVHNYTTTGPYTAVLLVTSNKGCVDSIVHSINTIYAQPQAAISAVTEICLGDTVSFTDQSTAPNSTVTQWLWNFGDGTTSTQQNPIHVYAAAGTYSVTLTIQSAIGCVSTVATHSITVHSLPTADFSFSAPNCVTNNISFSDLSVANSGSLVKWTWNMGDGTSAVNTTNLPFTHSYAATGNYTVTLTVESSKGCVKTTSKSITIHPLPVPLFGIPGNCISDPFSQFTDSSTIADGTQAQFSYYWNFGDPNATTGNPNTSSVKNPQHHYTAIGTYNVKLVVTSVNGCVDSLTRIFTINGAQPLSSFSITGGNQQCSNTIVSVKDNSTVDFGNVVKLEIFWDYANDPTIKTLQLNPPPGASYTHSYPEFFTPITKNVVIRVIAYSGDNCFHTTTQTVTLKATPELAFAALPSVCADLAPFQITQASLLNGLPGSGVFTGPGVSLTGTFTPQIAGVGTHVIRYTYTGANGCSNFKDQNITVFAVPTVDAGPDRFVLEGGNIQLLGAGSANVSSFLWSPPVNLSNLSVAQPFAAPLNDQLYTLQATTADGCTASDQVFVKVLKAPTIPNVFTPNHDGFNDRWEIKYLDTYPGCTVEVYNRYGQLVFQSTGYSKPWDGTYKGKDLPAGTYYYLINPKNGRQQISGFVDIVR